MKAFGGNPNAPGTEDGARGAIFVVASTILVTCRPSGSPRYTTDQMVERAATIAHSPDGASWPSGKNWRSPPPSRPPHWSRATLPTRRAPRSLPWNRWSRGPTTTPVCANRGEFGKAWAAFSPSAPADGRDPKVVANYLGKTPQARAPPASVTADEPGVARYDLKRKFFNKFAKSLPRARKGGPTQVDYELIRIITESTDGADCLFNFCTSVGWGVMHERLKRLEDDLNAVCLWKDDGVSCRPLGLCSIFTRSAERCIALQERDWAEQFCTTQLPEVAKARAEALEDATVTTATAEAAYTSRCITHGLDSTEAKAALADLEAAEAAEERARAPVNFPKNYAFSKNGTHLYAHTVAGWHGTKPENATISGDKENFYNTIAQALTADNKPDPNGCGRVKLLDRGSASDALTSYPSLASSWARPASSALSRPRAPCGCLPPTAVTWTSPPPIGAHSASSAPTTPTPTTPSPPAGSSRDVRCPPSSASASSTTSATPLRPSATPRQPDHAPHRFCGRHLPERRALARRRRLLRTKGHPRGAEEGSERLRRRQ